MSTGCPKKPFEEFFGKTEWYFLKRNLALKSLIDILFFKVIYFYHT